MSRLHQLAVIIIQIIAKTARAHLQGQNTNEKHWRAVGSTYSSWAIPVISTFASLKSINQTQARDMRHDLVYESSDNKV